MSAAITAAVISVAGGAMISSKNAKASNQAADKASYAANMQADIASDQWERYKQVYAPLEDQMVADAQDYGKTWRYDAAASQAASTVDQQFDKARMQLQRTPGMDPSSGAYTAGLANLELGRAAASASAQNLARKVVDDTAYTRKQSAVAMGKGLDSAAASGLASASNQQMALAQAQGAKAAGTAQAFGNVANRVVNGLSSSNWLGSGSTVGYGLGLTNISPQAVQAANATPDPIGTLNASQGWTGATAAPAGGDIFFGV